MWVPAPAELTVLLTRLPSSGHLTHAHSYTSGDMGTSLWFLSSQDKAGWTLETSHRQNMLALGGVGPVLPLPMLSSALNVGEEMWGSSVRAPTMC